MFAGQYQTEAIAVGALSCLAQIALLFCHGKRLSISCITTSCSNWFKKTLDAESCHGISGIVSATGHAVSQRSP